MEGAHDMGGVKWSGPVRPEPDEPVFHAEWERRALPRGRLNIPAIGETLALERPG